MSRDLRELLKDTAVRPHRQPDPARLVERGRRRRRTRRAAVGAGAAALVATALVVALPAGTPTSPEIAEQPSPPVSEQPTEADSANDIELGPELTLADDGSIRGLAAAPDHGVLVQMEGGVTLVGVDGSAIGHLDGAELTPMVMPGATGAAHLPSVTVDGWGEVWLDPVTATWQPAYLATPLRDGHWVVYDVDQVPEERMQLYGPSADEAGASDVMATWPEGEQWWVSNDHRVVTWRACWDDHECPNAFYDTDMGGTGELEPGCWVANSFGDFAFTEICFGSEVATSFGPDRTSYQVPPGTDGTAGNAVAAFDGGIVRVDRSCEIVEPMQIVEGEGLVPLLGGDPASNPSAVPLGTTPDGRVVLHFNAAGCDATAEAPGVYLYDLETGDRELVFEATLHTRFVQMWTPAAAAAIQR